MLKIISHTLLFVITMVCFGFAGDPNFPSYIDAERYRIEKFETLVPLYNGVLKKVQTTVLLPKELKKGTPLKTLVMIYPGYNFGLLSEPLDGSSITISNFHFVEHGYAILLPDLTIAPEGMKGNPIQEMTDILLPQIYHAGYLGLIDIAHVGIIGHSYGGYGTVAILTRTSLFRAGVAIAGVYDLGGNYGEFDNQTTLFEDSWAENGQGRMITHPWDNPLRYMENSPYYLADKIQSPLMLIHGSGDLNCSVMESKKMYSALMRLKKEVILKIYPDQGHSIDGWNGDLAREASEEIFRFFDQRL